MAYTKSSLNKSLKVFFQNNPHSALIKRKSKDGEDLYRVSNPWGDDTMITRLPRDDKERRAIIRSLNKLWLPSRFTAIYHVKSKKFEVIWTAYKLSGSSKEVLGRKFEFEYKGQKHDCEFSESSAELLTLAKHTYPNKPPSITSHRNMNSYHRYSKGGRDAPIGKPVSFWVSDIPQDEEFIVGFVKVLNFYLRYFDIESPYMLVHTLLADNESPQAVKRYRNEEFPKKIRAKSLDENSLVFWESALTADTITKFLLYYKIIEYSAHQYVSDAVRAKLQRILLGPTALNNVDQTIGEIASNLTMEDLDIYQRSKKLLREVVNPNLLWIEIAKNRVFFQERNKFDGGYTTKQPLIGKKHTKSTFADSGLLNFYERIKDIRNALSHGKDIETQAVILPTSKNERSLLPWVNLLEIVVKEVISNKDTS